MDPRFRGDDSMYFVEESVLFLIYSTTPIRLDGVITEEKIFLFNAI